MTYPLGASYLGEDRSHFHVWAPRARKVAVHIVAPGDRIIDMQPADRGYHQVLAEDIAPGTFYYYCLDEKTEKPDPVSHSQPKGIHGPSEVVDATYPWEDALWSGVDLHDFIIYEVHVGTFTEEGTFEAAIHYLDELKSLGISALELMPVAQFPGTRNWGYDGAYPFAVQKSYGGPTGLKMLVDACHLRGLAVVLDVVYNHLGPEGNYLDLFGPYFTDRYRTPWGPAINFDGPESDEVRRFFIENALYWVKTFHIDALRLDAIHAIVDPSARPFLEELGMAVHEEAERLKRKVYVIAESDRNDSRIIRTRAQGGYGLDAQWSDDFHHALHTLLTGERKGYYCDFGTVSHLAKAYREGFVYSGQFSAYRKRRHGNSSNDLPSARLVVCVQNHDQVGNRMRGERLSRLVSFDALKLAAGVVLLSPYIPLLFMGEEYGEKAPFQYFISHSDPALIEAVRRGRQEEFAAFEWLGEIPDPQSENTFQSSKLNHKSRLSGNHLALYNFCRELIRVRKELPAFSQLNKEDMETIVCEEEKLLWVKRWSGKDQAIVAFNLNNAVASTPLPFQNVSLNKILDSADQRWQGGGGLSPDRMKGKSKGSIAIAATSFVLYHSNGG